MDAEVFLIREFTQKGSLPFFLFAFLTLFALLLAEKKEQRQKGGNNRW